MSFGCATDFAAVATTLVLLALLALLAVSRESAEGLFRMRSCSSWMLNCENKVSLTASARLALSCASSLADISPGVLVGSKFAATKP